jgi:hypothetical protein
MVLGTRPNHCGPPKADVSARKLHPQIAAGLAPLMHLQLWVLEKTEFEKCLGKLERLMRAGIMENREGNPAEEIREKGVEPGQTETINSEKRRFSVRSHLHTGPSEPFTCTSQGVSLVVSSTRKRCSTGVPRLPESGASHLAETEFERQ